MTLVAAWLDWTNQQMPRLLCFADSRISNTQTQKAITDHSAKLFRFAVALHLLSDFDIFNGTLSSPYFETAIGVAYSGDLVLADTVTSILSQTFANLAIEDPSKPLITWTEICSHVEGVLKAVAKTYAAIEKMTTTFLVFGHFEEKFRLTKCLVTKAGAVSIEPIDLYDERHISIGTGGAAFDSCVKRAIGTLRMKQTVAKARFEHADQTVRDDREVELALARSDASRALRTAFETQIRDEALSSVGGTMQLLEVTPHFVAFRKTSPGGLLGAHGVERAGRFQVLIVTEGT